jgi:hypothetical protein
LDLTLITVLLFDPWLIDFDFLTMSLLTELLAVPFTGGIIIKLIRRLSWGWEFLCFCFSLNSAVQAINKLFSSALPASPQ